MRPAHAPKGARRRRYRVGKVLFRSRGFGTTIASSIRQARRPDGGVLQMTSLPAPALMGDSLQVLREDLLAVLRETGQPSPDAVGP